LTRVGHVTIGGGETMPFVVTYSSSPYPPPAPGARTTALERTEAFWLDWTGKCSAEGPWHEAVVRSLITLKALTYAPTGGIVAAPTTSLPEHPGGPRNWDYRFCWLRDATLTLLAMMHAGIHWEAQACRDWMVRAVAGSAYQVQPLYGISGERHVNEWIVPWLPGFANSKPVRVGNAAHRQFQLDVFGEVMDALHQARRSGLTTSESGWRVQVALMGTLRGYGRNPTKAYGKFARSGGISPIRRSWLGWRSIEPSKAQKVLASRDRLTGGDNCGRRFAPRYASAASTPNSAASFSPTDRNR